MNSLDCLTCAEFARQWACQSTRSRGWHKVRQSAPTVWLRRPRDRDSLCASYMSYMCRVRSTVGLPIHSFLSATIQKEVERARERASEREREKWREGGRKGGRGGGREGGRVGGRKGERERERERLCVCMSETEREWRMRHT